MKKYKYAVFIMFFIICCYVAGSYENSYTLKECLVNKSDSVYVTNSKGERWRIKDGTVIVKVHNKKIKKIIVKP